jgi:divalent metal cation (Fe/Co/Zn/Cd) transporter
MAELNKRIFRNLTWKNMKDMLVFFVVLVAMITAIIVGIFALYYALTNALVYIGIFIIGSIGLALGLFTLKVVTDKLK